MQRLQKFMKDQDSVNGSVCHKYKLRIILIEIFCALSDTFTVRTY